MPVVLECEHRGEELRLESCATCQGKVLIRVHSCSKHGECTVSKAIPGVHVCDANRAAPVARRTPKPIIYASGSASEIQAATLIESVAEISPTVSVRLDDGRTIQATNERARARQRNMRCVVGMVGDKWILLQ